MWYFFKAWIKEGSLNALSNQVGLMFFIIFTKVSLNNIVWNLKTGKKSFLNLEFQRNSNTFKKTPSLNTIFFRTNTKICYLEGSGSPLKKQKMNICCPVWRIVGYHLVVSATSQCFFFFFFWRRRDSIQNPYYKTRLYQLAQWLSMSKHEPIAVLILLIIWAINPWRAWILKGE